MLSFGLRRTMEQCREMIRSVTKEKDLRGGKEPSGIGRHQFGEMMMPLMQEELFQQEDRVEDLRARFLEADVDYSGFLSVDELWNVLQKMGADVSHEDVIQLMSEIDVDRDG